jgi:MYXO-CTERM domain-containing protein
MGVAMALRTLSLRSAHAFGLVTLAAAAAACNQAPTPAPSPVEGAVGQAPAEIVGGAPDTDNQAVVAIFMTQSKCTGTLIHVDGAGDGYVLTAAHCVDDSLNPPEEVVFGDDHNSPDATFPVSEYVIHPGWDGDLYDFAVLKIPNATGMPVIPAMAPEEDNLVEGDQLDFVGYGLVDGVNKVSTSVRQHVVQILEDVPYTNLAAVDSLTVEYYNGVGPCSGDSGGPALSFGTQRVAAVTSYGDSSCTLYGVSGRVSSVYQDFILPYLEGSGSAPPPSDCTSCSQDAVSGGSCADEWTACENDAECQEVLACYGQCNTATCFQQCDDAYPNGAAIYFSVNSCICNVDCASECQTECAGNGAGEVQACGFALDPPTCNGCMEVACCSDAQACYDDDACFDCIAYGGPSGDFSCLDTDVLANNFATCLSSQCETECYPEDPGTGGAGGNGTGGNGTGNTGTGNTGNGGASNDGTSTSTISCSTANGPSKGGEWGWLIAAGALGLVMRRRGGRRDET